MSLLRTRWAAIGAAVAVTLGGGGIGLVHATRPADAVTFVAITPCRVIDTRPAYAIGPKTSPLGAGETHTVSTHGKNGECTGIPSTAVAVSMNMTSTDATAPTFLTVWAADAPQPNSSNLNPIPGAPATPNAVTTGVSATGQFKIYNLAGTVNVLADINGYYVGHDHDDRYYTKAQTDAALAGKASASGVYTKGQTDSRIAAAIAGQPWSESLPVETTYTEGSAAFTVGGGGSITGLWMPGGVFSRIGVGWTLPPEYTPGTDIELKMTWARRPGIAGSCVYRLRSNGATRHRAGGPESYLISGFTPSTPGTNFSGDTALMPYPGTNDVQELVVDIGGGGLEPGDHMSYLFFRDGANVADTCTATNQAFVLLGMSAEGG